MKHLAIFLSMLPNEGGKFQYSLSLMLGLCALDPAEYKISAIFYDRAWFIHVPKQANVECFQCQRIIPARLVRKILLTVPHGLSIWRRIGTIIDPVHKLLCKLKPDLMFYPGIDSLAYEVRLPSVVPIYDLMHRYEKDFPEVSMNGIFKDRERHYINISRYAKGVLVDSEVGRKHALESYGFDHKRIYILPYVKPPYVENFESSPEKPNGQIPDRFIFYPAQLWKHKNHCGIIRAISLLKEKGLIVNAVFVGAKKNAAIDIINLIDELVLNDQIYFLGYVSDEELVWLYKNAVALVMPTFFGPTNVPPLEAFALGCPVITSNIYATPWQVGDAAILVDPGDCRDIAEKIELVWTKEEVRQKLIQNGKRRDLEWNQYHFNKRVSEIVSNMIT